MRINDRGNEVYNDAEADQKLATFCDGATRGHDRYHYDFEALKTWKQFDTWQDASYFGMWVNVEQRLTFTYAEGDRCLVVCPTLESFRAELQNACEFYGEPPAAFTAIGMDGSITKYYDARPTV